MLAYFPLDFGIQRNGIFPPLGLEGKSEVSSVSGGLGPSQSRQF
jgi:hypothetical protein